MGATLLSFERDYNPNFPASPQFAAAIGPSLLAVSFGARSVLSIRIILDYLGPSNFPQLHVCISGNHIRP